MSQAATQPIPGYCALCRSRCGTLNVVRDGRLVEVLPNPAHPTGRALCAKGRAAPELVHHPERLRVPLARIGSRDEARPRWREIGWDEAIGRTVAELDRLRNSHGAESVAFSVTSPSGSPVSDGIDWIERFIRGFGSPNTCYATELCNWHKDVAHEFTFGCPIPTPDYRNAGLIVLWGHNPANVWLSQAEAISAGLERGARMLVVDPRRTAHAARADLWVRIRPGADAAFAMGVAREMIRGSLFDETFVRQWTNGPLLVAPCRTRLLRMDDLATGVAGDERFVAWDAFAGRCVPIDTRLAPDPQLCARLMLRGETVIDTRAGEAACATAFEHYARACEPFTVGRVAEMAWVPPEQIVRAAVLMSEADSVCYYGWTGVGQHANATQTERALALVHALTGSFDAPGGNRRWQGPARNAVNGLDLLSPAQWSRALGAGQRPIGPAATGWVTAEDLYTAILEHRPYPVRALVGFGANALVTQPDPVRGRQALQALEFHVHCNLFMTPTAAMADLVLPVSTPWEREGLRVGFEIDGDAQQWVQLRSRMVSPIGQARSDTEIVFELARHLVPGDPLFAGGQDAALNHVLAPLDLDVARLRAEPGGVPVPCEQPDRAYAGSDGDTVRGFDTPSRRVEIYSQRLAAAGYPGVPGIADALDPALTVADSELFPCLLTTAKSGYYCHSQHRGLASLRMRHPEPMLRMNGSTARAGRLRAGERVRVVSDAGQAVFRLAIDEDLHPRVLVGDFGWWQSCPELGLPGYDPGGARGSNYNALVPRGPHDPVSGAPSLRAIACRVEPLGRGRRRIARALYTDGDRLRLEVESARMDAACGVLHVALRGVRGRNLPGYHPGQYITLGLDGLPGAGRTARVERSYSLTGSASPDVVPRYRVAIRVRPGDEDPASISHRLPALLVPGVRLPVAPPAGRFTLPGAGAGASCVFIAAGIGITPFISSLETAAEMAGGGRAIVFHVNRNAVDAPFRERLQALQGALPGVTVVSACTEDAGREAVWSKLGDALDAAAPSPAATPSTLRWRYYLCGPEGFMEAADRWLQGRGVLPFDIFREYFVRAAPLPLDTLAPGTVTFRRSGRTVEWNPGRGTLLDLATAEGIGISSGCRVGQCESCLVRVLEGEVVHFGSGTPPAPDQCLSCSAMPRGNVTLDA